MNNKVYFLIDQRMQPLNDGMVSASLGLPASPFKNPGAATQILGPNNAQQRRIQREKEEDKFQLCVLHHFMELIMGNN